MLMEIHFYPLDFDYKVKDKGTYVYIYGKLESGDPICVAIIHRPFFYARVDGIEQEELRRQLKALEIKTSEETARIVSWEEDVEKELLGKKVRFWKLYANYPKAVPLLSQELESWGLKCHEKDILFIHRFLRDVDITPMTLVQAQGQFVEEKGMRVPVFLADRIEQLSREHVSNLKILAIDIETYSLRREINPQKNPILMIGFYGLDGQGKEFRKVLTWRKFNHGLDYMEHVQDEVELLERFRKIILDYQPDILAGYFSDGFDMPYLKARADKHNVKLDLGKDQSELIAGTRADFREGESKIKGIIHLDVLKFIRNIFGKNLDTDSYSLDAVAGELLGHNKHAVNLNELADSWDRQPEKLAAFCEYNLHDAYLALKLCEKLLPEIIEFTKIIGLPLYDVIRMRFSKLVESYILKRAAEYNVIAPNRPGSFEIEQRMETTYEGGFVFEPTPGIYDRIVVFDFRSLYPTIITAHNLGPESLCRDGCVSKEQVPGMDRLWFCQDEKVFLPSVLERLILLRADLNRLIKEEKLKGQDTRILKARSYALKILANSFYGYQGFFGARWYCLECARATTAYARDYIKNTIKKAQGKGFQVCYGDTDSLFILLGDKVQDQAMEFMNEINFDLPGHMELEFEGYYPKGIFVAQKGSEKGAKKKYALLSEDGSVKITGFETVRRNWSQIAKEVQENVLRLVLEDKVKEAIDYVKSISQDLKAGKIPNSKLILRTQITKELSNYAAVGPHVAVAKRLAEKGEPVLPGTLVEYIIAKGFGIVRERAKLVEEVNEGDYDAEYYLYNQIIPAVSSIFTVLGYNEDEIFSESSQKGLGDFF